MYNHFIGGVDQFDQLKSYYSTQRVHRKTWRALFHLLLDIALVNSFKLAALSVRDRKCSGHKKWRLKLVKQLFESSCRQVVLRKQGAKRQVLAGRVKHEMGRLPGGAKACISCAANGRRSKPVSKRTPLAEKSNNRPKAVQTRKRSIFGCIQCNIALCKSTKTSTKPCWEEHLHEAKNRCKLLSRTSQDEKENIPL